MTSAKPQSQAMQPLPTTFNQDDFSFNQVTRTGAIALFSKSKPNHPKPCFEVVKVQQIKAKTILGRFVPEHEAMPSSSKWGMDGWSYSDLPSAQARFDKLVAEQDMAALVRA